VCRNVETPKSSRVSLAAHDAETADEDEVKQVQVTRDDEQPASVLSKYVDLLLFSTSLLTHRCSSEFII